MFSLSVLSRASFSTSSTVLAKKKNASGSSEGGDSSSSKGTTVAEEGKSSDAVDSSSQKGRKKRVVAKKGTSGSSVKKETIVSEGSSKKNSGLTFDNIDTLLKGQDRFDTESNIEKLRDIYFRNSTENDPFFYGDVTSAGDSILQIKNLETAFPGEMLFFNIRYSDSYAQVYDVYADGTCSAVILGGKISSVRAGDKVVRSGYPIRVPTGFGVLGMVVHGTGQCINYEDFDPSYFGYYSIFNTRLLPLESKAPGIVERTPVRFPVFTGYSLVDNLLPIGCGQRELIIGDKNTGKTSLAIGIVLNQRFYNYDWYKRWRAVEGEFFGTYHGSFKPCVYVSVGQRRSEINRIYDVFREFRALEFSHVFFSVADDNPGLQYLGPFAGTTICEVFSSMGYDSILIFDDLSNHAVAYRQISLLLRRPPGREAYPGDVFYTHSRLLERSAQLVKGVGAGSVTCFPIIETKGNDISAFIPTNVISITDGQIYLSLDAVRTGMRPAIELGLSVSRVGSSAQPSAVSKVAGMVKKDYSRYRSFESLDGLGGINDPYIVNALIRGRRLKRLFKQPLYGTLRLYKQIVTCIIICKGFVDDVHDNFILMFLANLFSGKSHKYLNMLKNLDLRRRIGFVLVNLKNVDQFFYSHKLSSLFSDVFEQMGEMFSRFFRANLSKIVDGSLSGMFQRATEGFYSEEGRKAGLKFSKKGRERDKAFADKYADRLQTEPYKF